MKLDFITTSDKEPQIIQQVMRSLLNCYRAVTESTLEVYAHSIAEHCKGDPHRAFEVVTSMRISAASQMLLELAATADDAEETLRDFAKSLTMLPAMALVREIKKDFDIQKKNRSMK
jgi:hypothetical protein